MNFKVYIVYGDSEYHACCESWEDSQIFLSLDKAIECANKRNKEDKIRYYAIHEGEIEE